MEFKEKAEKFINNMQNGICELKMELKKSTKYQTEFTWDSVTLQHLRMCVLLMHYLTSDQENYHLSLYAFVPQYSVVLS